MLVLPVPTPTAGGERQEDPQKQTLTNKAMHASRVTGNFSGYLSKQDACPS